MKAKDCHHPNPGARRHRDASSVICRGDRVFTCRKEGQGASGIERNKDKRNEIFNAQVLVSLYNQGKVLM